MQLGPVVPGRPMGAGQRRCSGNRWFSTWRLFLELPRAVLPHRNLAEVPQEQGGRAEQGLGCATLCCSIGWEQGEECRWVAFTQPWAGGEIGVRGR